MLILNLEYSAPYSNLVPDNPSKDIMRSVVVSKELRPNMKEKWYKNKTSKVFISIIEESWDKDPESRLMASAMISRIENCAVLEVVKLD